MRCASLRQWWRVCRPAVSLGEERGEGGKKPPSAVTRRRLLHKPSHDTHTHKHIHTHTHTCLLSLASRSLRAKRRALVPRLEKRRMRPNVLGAVTSSFRQMPRCPFSSLVVVSSLYGALRLALRPPHCRPFSRPRPFAVLHRVGWNVCVGCCRRRSEERSIALLACPLLVLPFPRPIAAVSPARPHCVLSLLRRKGAFRSGRCGQRQHCLRGDSD